MPSPHAIPSSLPGRILARLFLIGFGFLLGVALFTPWDKIWSAALASADERLPMIGLRWESIDRDGPLGFRVNGLKISVLDTPGRFAFRHAYVRVGFSPLARVRLDTGGPQCELEVHRSGVFEFEGDLNLTYLLSQADFKGVLHVAGNLFMPAGTRLPRSGWVDVRSQQLVLPGEKIVEDLAITAEVSGPEVDIRDFSMGLPINIKAAGTGRLDPDNLYRTTFDLTGEMTVGQRTMAYEAEGRLDSVVW